MSLNSAVCHRAIRDRDPRYDGRFFVAALTTGIFCRPTCRCRTPKREHLRFLASAAAAEAAGFRPCLRCRPENAPELGGVVRERVDASPASEARARRALFAKKLITDTRMPLAEVARAAGFGSARRLNATFRDRYGYSPRELRGGARGTEAGAAGVSLLLPYVPPYDWPSLVAFLRLRAIPGVESVGGDGVYRRTIREGRAAGALSAAPSPGEDALRVEIRFPEVSALYGFVEKLRSLFDLGADPRAIARDLSRSAELRPRLRARPGLRVPGAWDGFELGVRAVLGQQITVAGASTLAGRLVATYGDPLPCAEGTGLTHTFPLPERLVTADLRGIGVTRARARTLTALAAAALKAPALFAPADSLESSVARLREIPGIGDWTAQYIAMRALREPDAFPAADLGLQHACADPDGRRPRTAELRARAEAWRPWRAYAALQLWTSLSERRSAGRAAA
ncbi:MAG: DNA-3-methyladenine glycosylase 2 family protein [Myxococcales bacterium]|nr:DNA-3-methyladenine glycosylase 2 family protein [Myxococcales bacterium]